MTDTARFVLGIIGISGGILLEKMDAEIIHKVLRKNDVIGFILSEGKNKELKDFLRQKSGN